ncbi:MAG: LysR family transcriptional regulator [Nitrospirota bacterium]
MKVDDSTPAETERQPNFNHLWLFYNVARFGSVSAAARALRTSQPSISRQVRTLAENLGTDLFVRKGRTILLTDAGRLLFDHAQRIFTLGADAVRTIQEWSGGRTARLAIGAVPPLRDYWLPARLGELLRALPDIDVRCGPHENIEERLVTGGSDVALIDAPAASDALFSEPLFSAPLVLMGRSADGPARGGAAKKRGKKAETEERIGEALAKNTLLVPAYQGWRGPVTKFLEETRIRPARIQVREGIEGLVRCVEEGVGLAFLPAYVSAGRRLARLGGERAAVPMTAWVVMARGRNPTPPLLAFLAILRRAAGQAGRVTEPA